MLLSRVPSRHGPLLTADWPVQCHRAGRDDPVSDDEEKEVPNENDPFQTATGNLDDAGDGKSVEEDAKNPKKSG